MQWLFVNSQQSQLKTIRVLVDVWHAPESSLGKSRLMSCWRSYTHAWLVHWCSYGVVVKSVHWSGACIRPLLANLCLISPWWYACMVTVFYCGNVVLFILFPLVCCSLPLIGSRDVVATVGDKINVHAYVFYHVRYVQIITLIYVHILYTMLSCRSQDT